MGNNPWYPLPKIGKIARKLNGAGACAVKSSDLFRRSGVPFQRNRESGFCAFCQSWLLTGDGALIVIVGEHDPVFVC